METAKDNAQKLLENFDNNYKEAMLFIIDIINKAKDSKNPVSMMLTSQFAEVLWVADDLKGKLSSCIDDIEILQTLSDLSHKCEDRVDRRFKYLFVCLDKDGKYIKSIPSFFNFRPQIGVAYKFPSDANSYRVAKEESIINSVTIVTAQLQ